MEKSFYGTRSKKPQLGPPFFIQSIWRIWLIGSRASSHASSAVKRWFLRKQRRFVCQSPRQSPRSSGQVDGERWSCVDSTLASYFFEMDCSIASTLERQVVSSIFWSCRGRGKATISSNDHSRETVGKSCPSIKNSLMGTQFRRRLTFEFN